MVIVRTLGVLCFLSLVGGANAGPAADAAATCLTDSTTGRDRKDLVRWIFLAMAKHPELTNLGNITPNDDEESSRIVGALFTRLVAVDCVVEMSKLAEEQGAGAVSRAFEVLGRVAMQELMAHPNVVTSLSALDRQIDREKISAAQEAQK